jgi:hypothetical protein
VVPPEISDGPVGRAPISAPPNQGGGFFAGGMAAPVSGEAPTVFTSAPPIGTQAGDQATMTNYGADTAYMDKMRRTQQLAEKLGQFKQLPPEQQQQMLAEAGVDPANMPSIYAAIGGELKEQQKTMAGVGTAAEEEAQAAPKQAKVAQYIANVATTLAMIGMGPAAAVTYGTTVGAGAFAAEVAKSAMIYRISGLGGEEGVSIAHKISPNAGPATDLAANLIGGLVTGVPAAATMEAGGSSWIKAASDEHPEVAAAVGDTQHTYTDPVGLKPPPAIDPYTGIDLSEHLVTPESKVRDAKIAALREENLPQGPEFQHGIPQAPERPLAEGLSTQPSYEPEKPPTAEAPPEEPPAKPAGRPRDARGRFMAALTKAERGSFSTQELSEEQMDALKESLGAWAIPAYRAAMAAGDTDKMEQFHDVLPDHQKPLFGATAEGRDLVSPEQIATSTKYRPEGRSAVSSRTVTDINGEKTVTTTGEPPPEEGKAAPTKTAAEAPKLTKEQKVAAAQKEMIANRGAMAKRLGLAQNEDTVNLAIKRNRNAPITNEQATAYNQASAQSIDNIQKLAGEHLDAAANNDLERVGTAGDLFQHEVAKLAHLQTATGESTSDIAQSVAEATSKSSDILQQVGALKGSAAERAGKTRAIMGWQKTLDPANIAVAAALWNPKLWAAKAVTDVTWLSYQNAMKGVARAFSAHPQDAFQMWAASAKGAMEAPIDAIKYAGSTLAYGGKQAEINLGMMRGEPNTSTTLFDDFAETNPGEAIQYLASVYSSGVTGQIKRVAGMALNAGPRVILAEDQFAKTFAFRAAVRTAALSKALEEANTQGLWGAERWKFAKGRAEELVNDMPDDLVKAASDEAYQFTFTNYNKTAAAIQKGANYLTIPATRYSPEVHFGRLMGGMFISTPFNMMKEAFLNTPIGFIMPKSAGYWGESGLQSTPAITLAAGKGLAGAAIMLALYEHAGNLNLTGSGLSLTPDQRKLREERNIPNNSIGFGDHYWSYEAMGPMRPVIGFAADMAEAHAVSSLANKGAYWQHAMMAFSQVLDQAPLMHQFPNIFHALASMSQGNYNEGVKYLEDAASMPIRPAIVSQISHALDPALREATTWVQRLRLDWPGHHADIPLKLNHWGYPQYVPPSYESEEIPPNPLEAYAYVFSPFHQTPMRDPDEVDAELGRLGVNLDPTADFFIGNAGHTGIRADPDDPHVGVPYHPTDPIENARLKNRMAEIQGHEVQINGMNKHDYMLNFMHSPEYAAHNDYWRTSMMQKVDNKFTNAARVALVKENPDLGERVLERLQQKRTEMYGPPIGAP